MKAKMFDTIDAYRDEMIALSDDIYDHPELALKEYHAADVLIRCLEDKGCRVERGVGGLETAFRTQIKNLEGGPTIGLLAEYDALPGVHHACGHHMQGPVMIAAFMALADCLPKDKLWTIVLYGTPGEEGGGGKVIMSENGCFKELDVALMMHGGDMTTYDPTMSANVSYKVTFTSGEAEDIWNSPAFDAQLITMHALEFMREHMPGNARIHYALSPVEQAQSVSANYMLRCLNDAYLDAMIARFNKALEGAALITGARCGIVPSHRLCAVFPNEPLAELFYKNAEEAGAERIAPARGTMGSTDFGNVMSIIPGFCARVAFAPKGTGAHSLEWANAGKSLAAHNCVMTSAKLIAGMAYELITEAGLVEKVHEDFIKQREKANQT